MGTGFRTRSCSKKNLKRNDDSNDKSLRLSPPREAGDEALHGGFQLLRVAREAQAQETAARGSEGAAGGKADARLVDQAQRQPARVALAFDREEQIKRTLRHREPASRSEEHTSELQSRFGISY